MINQMLLWWLRWQRICLQCRIPGFYLWVRKIPWKREWLPTPIFLPGESHEQRSLAGYSPWCCKESNMTDQLSTVLLDISVLVPTVSHSCRLSPQETLILWFDDFLLFYACGFFFFSLSFFFFLLIYCMILICGYHVFQLC